MTKFELIFLTYMSVISLASIIMTVSDKRRAVRSRRRVPEATLIFFAVLGGSVAMLLTMFAVHHKTKKPKFMLGIPLIIILQCAAVYFIYK